MDMKEFVLVIAVLTGDGQALESVPGFHSKQSCESAGEIIKERLPPRRRGSTEFACIEIK